MSHYKINLSQDVILRLYATCTSTDLILSFVYAVWLGPALNFVYFYLTLPHTYTVVKIIWAGHFSAA
jgi:hypothetical protein